MILIFAKILSVFSILLIGYAANRMKWLPIESTKYLSLLLVNIASPCLIIYSMSRQELNRETVSSVVQAFGLMVLAMVVTTGISALTVRIMKTPPEERGVYRALLVLTNSAFMGFPLSLAVFGEKGLFLTIIANAAFTLYCYSAGILILISGRDEKLTVKEVVKSIVSIPVVSCLVGLSIFIFGIRLPELLVDFLDTVGAITIPLSMIIIGIQLAESKVGEVLRNKHIFETLILKLVLVPAILIGIFIWLPVYPLVLCVVVFNMAMPSAAITPVLAEIYGMNAKLAAQSVFINTIFSLISIPVYALILHHFL